LQVKQAAPQAWLQQTPSTQNSEPQSPATVQASPSCFKGLSGIAVSPPVSTFTCMSCGVSYPASFCSFSPPPPHAPATSSAATRTWRRER
jgi:hypothetical protein